jgi:hypothetical protein
LPELPAQPGAPFACGDEERAPERRLPVERRDDDRARRRDDARDDPPHVLRDLRCLREHGPAEHQQRWIEDHAQIRRGHPDQRGGVVDDPSGRFVNRRRGVHQPAYASFAAVVSRLRPSRGDGFRAGERFEASARTVLGVDVLWSHAHERDLAREKMTAVVHFAVDHDAGADALADADERAAVVTACGTAPVLAEDGEVHVVVDDDRRAERPLQDVRHRHVRPVLQVRRERHDDAERAIDDAGRAGADRNQS